MTGVATEVTPESGGRPRAVVLREIREFFRNGEFFRAYDLALAGLEQFPGDGLLAHRAVLSLANCGATELALARFSELGLDRSQDRDARTLLGRLKKDQAFAAEGTRRQQLFEEAQAIYEAAFRQAEAAGDGEAYYPAINAATLALFAGDAAKSAALARAVLTLLHPRLAAAQEGAAPDRYWVLATAIEAHLLIGETAAAAALIAPAMAAMGDNYAELASTGRQIERVLAARGEGVEILGPFAPPAILHYTGHIMAAPGRDGRFPAAQERTVAAEIAGLLAGMRTGAAYGALAAGSDILVAEAVLARGAALNIVLPFNVEEFIDISVRPAGEAWVPRFHACLAAAKTVRFATEDAYLGDDQLFAYAGRLAMGLAVLCARHLHAPSRQLAVWDGEPRSGVAGTVIDMMAWRKAGLPQTIIRCGSRAEADDLSQFTVPPPPPGRRAVRAMLFADVHGFSRLGDAELPVFTRILMGAIAEITDRYRADIAYINTWGDGVFAVFADVARAASCALVVQERLALVDLAAAGLPKDLALRLGGHFGPAYELDDPILRRPNFYGAHVSRAARIEPVTPTGCVYVTETFAAALAIAEPEEFACDYVGWTEMAKHYGRLRMFLLKRRRQSEGPAVLIDLSRQAQPTDGPAPAA